MALIYGDPAVAAGAGVRRAGCSTRRHRWRWLGWGLAAAVVAGSLLAADNLTGALRRWPSRWRSAIGAALVARR